MGNEGWRAGRLGDLPQEVMISVGTWPCAPVGESARQRSSRCDLGHSCEGGPWAWNIATRAGWQVGGARCIWRVCMERRLPPGVRVPLAARGRRPGCCTPRPAAEHPAPTSTASGMRNRNRYTRDPGGEQTGFHSEENRARQAAGGSGVFDGI